LLFRLALQMVKLSRFEICKSFVHLAHFSQNYDTDERIESQDTPSQFYVEGVTLPEGQMCTLDECLRQLRISWPERVQRFSLDESEFLLQYKSYLEQLAEARINHVFSWLKANTARFGEKSEVLTLFRAFDTSCKELRRSIQLCGSKCSSCGLLCLDHKQHEGTHNCMTSHKCPNACGFAEQHEGHDIPACDLP
jgi:hypothetical protein